MMVVMTYNKLFTLGRKEIVYILSAIIIYGILALLIPSTQVVKLEAALLLLTGVIILMLQTEMFRKRKTLQEATVFLLVILSLSFNGYAFYSPAFIKYSDEFMTRSEVDNTSQGVLSLIAGIRDTSFYRIETYGDKTQNEALNLDYNDVSGYFSLMDGAITSYFKGLELINQKAAIRFDDLDNRTILDALAGVKYIVTTDETAAPYGYKRIDKIEEESIEYYLLENEFALPLGYTYDNYMLAEDYDKLNALEKQNALLNAVILDNDNNLGSKAEQDMANMGMGIKKLDYRIIPDNNISINNNTIQANKAGASITLEFTSEPETETYVRFMKLMINNKLLEEFLIKGENGADKNIVVGSVHHNGYFGKENYLVNTGYSETGKSWVKIIFPTKDTYSYNGIEVYSLDMNYYKQQLQALQQSTFKNINMSSNRVEGDITLSQDGIMALSIPFSKGWSAYVDGVKTTLLHGNIMYMALPLVAGSHHIVLSYTTPLIKAGGMVSLLSLVIFIGIIVYDRKRKAGRLDKIRPII